MSQKQDLDPNRPVPSANELRMALLEKEMEKLAKLEKARAAQQEALDVAAEEFLKGHVTDEERNMIRRLVRNAVEKGLFEVMVYSFPSDLCTDSGRAINNGEANWPKTLQGKALEFYERYKENIQPKGYKLKAMIINFPGGIPGDVGFFLNWAPPPV